MIWCFKPFERYDWHDCLENWRNVYRVYKELLLYHCDGRATGMLSVLLGLLRSLETGGTKKVARHQQTNKQTNQTNKSRNLLAMPRTAPGSSKQLPNLWKNVQRPWFASCLHRYHAWNSLAPLHDRFLASVQIAWDQSAGIIPWLLRSSEYIRKRASHHSEDAVFFV